MTAPHVPFRRVPFERLGGTSRLFRDYLHKADALRAFFGPPFDDGAALTRLVDQVRSRTYEREALCDTLAEQAKEMSATSAARASLEELRRRESLVVFAGQQPGLFSGPLYTVYKALTVERWANDLAARLGTTVVPCFWLSADDHDFAEVEWAGLPAEGAFQTVRWAPQTAPAGHPVGRVQLDAGIEQVVAALGAWLPESEFKPNVLATLRQTYAPGGRFVTALGRLWYTLFPESRLVFVIPGEGALARHAAPVLGRALADDGELYAAYRSDTEELLALGYHEQVHKSAEQTFLFYQKDKRQSIHTRGGELVWNGSPPVAKNVLLEQIQKQPEYFSPNVLLRPLLQNHLFPTVGVVLGPSELAYYAQIGRLHDHFGVPRPAVLPRTSATVVEPTVAKRLERLGAELPDLKANLDGEVARVLRARFPADLRERFEAAAGKVEAVFDEIRPEVTAFEPTLEAPARAAGVRARREMEQLAQRAHAAHKKKEEETESQLRRAALQLFPEGELQERKINVVYYWARYGPDWLSKLREHWPAGEREHLLWEG